MSSLANLSLDSNSALCVDVYGSMDWDYVFSMNGFVGLKHRAINLCIEANNWLISLAICNSQMQNQQWKMYSFGSAFLIINRNSSLCLTQSNKILIGFRCINTKNQIWLIKKTDCGAN